MDDQVSLEEYARRCAEHAQRRNEYLARKAAEAADADAVDGFPEKQLALMKRGVEIKRAFVEERWKCIKKANGLINSFFRPAEGTAALVRLREMRKEEIDAIAEIRAQLFGRYSYHFEVTISNMEKIAKYPGEKRCFRRATWEKFPDIEREIAQRSIGSKSHTSGSA